METAKKAKLIREAADGKRAQSIVTMDMRAVSNITDYFVICSAPSTRRVQAIAEAILEALVANGVRRSHVEGKKEALWVLIDCGDVMAHVFYEDLRKFYDLERLWHDAPKEYFSPRCESHKYKNS